MSKMGSPRNHHELGSSYAPGIVLSQAMIMTEDFHLYPQWAIVPEESGALSVPFVRSSSFVPERSNIFAFDLVEWLASG